MLVLRTIPGLVGEVCAKIGGDWSGGSGVKEGHR